MLTGKRSFCFALLGLAAVVGCQKPIEPPRHLLLVTIDTIRADRVGCYGKAGAGTPFLDQLAKEGARAERAYASAPLTLPSHISILTGLHPPHSGIHDNGEKTLLPKVVTLAERLSKAGFFTAAAVGGYPVASQFPTRKGFHAFDDHFVDPRNPAGLERPAGTVVDAALGQIEARGNRRLFLWVHFFDPHDPYEPPPVFAKAFPRDPYQGEIAAVDVALGRLISDLEQRLGKDPLLIAVVGDHGEALGEHGELTHGFFLYEPTLRVPMLFKGPGIPAGLILREPVQTVDLVPTLLSRLGLPLPTGLDGQELSFGSSTPPSPAPIYAETELPARHFGWAPLFAIEDGQFKLIEAPRPELYDLKADPRETLNQVLERPEAVVELRAILSRIRGKVVSTVREAPSDPNLASLGYVSSGGRSNADASLDPKDNLATFRKFQDVALALEQGDGPRALVMIDELLEVQSSPGLRFQRAKALGLSNRIKEATEELERLAATSPGFPGLDLERGKTRVWKGDGAGALTLLNRHLSLWPRDAGALLFRGAARELVGDIPGAEADYRLAISINPAVSGPWLRLAGVLVQQERFPEAIDELRELLRRFPSENQARNLLDALENSGRR